MAPLPRNETQAPAPAPQPVEQEVIPPTPRKAPRGEEAPQMPRVEKLSAAKGGREKPGPGRRPKAEYIRELADQLRGGHEMAFMFTGIEALRLTEDQAIKLAGPAYDTCIKYGIPINGVIGPEFSLLFSVGLIYGPMIFAVKAEVARRQAEQAADITPSTVIRPDVPAWRPQPEAPMPAEPTPENPIVFGEGAASAEGMTAAE